MLNKIIYIICQGLLIQLLEHRFWSLKIPVQLLVTRINMVRSHKSNNHQSALDSNHFKPSQYCILYIMFHWSNTWPWKWNFFVHNSCIQTLKVNSTYILRNLCLKLLQLINVGITKFKIIYNYLQLIIISYNITTKIKVKVN